MKNDSSENEKNNGFKHDSEQSYFDLVYCPKCLLAYFDIEEIDKIKWTNNAGTMFYVEMPSGEERRDLDEMIIECPICQTTIRVELNINLMFSVSYKTK